ncbi:hypothetical protein FS837_002965 [Tulasnella sp. UAMH 9824]|nr:hypothetical protein FS837_002965 [Tulasnella sp. UAMH 9824]
MVIVTFVLAISFFLSSILPASFAQQTRRRVVDDSDPTISYTIGAADDQPGQWAAMDATKQDAKCAAVNCLNVVDAAQVHGGTWHEGYGSVTISYTFNGTGIAAYFISSNPSGATANTSFFIDGELSQTVGGATNGMASPLSYNVQVFAISNLQDRSHELVISQSSGSSTLMFDYLTYEELVPDVASSGDLTSPTSAGVQTTTQPADPLRVPGSRGVARSVVGAAVATALVGTLLLIVAAGIFLRLRKRKSVAILMTSIMKLNRKSAALTDPMLQIYPILRSNIASLITSSPTIMNRQQVWLSIIPALKNITILTASLLL